MGGCCAPNCTNNSKKGKRCFVFPRNPERRAKWLQMCRRDKWQPTLYSTLCEVHFEESQYETSRADGWKKLKPNAVPTLFNVPSCPKQLTPKRRILQRSILTEGSCGLDLNSEGTSQATSTEKFKRNTKTGRLEEMPNNEDLQRQYPLQEIKPESIDIVEDDHSQYPFQEITPDAANVVEDDHSQHLLQDIKQEPMEIVETAEDCSQSLQVLIKQEEVDADSNSGDRCAEQFQGDGNEPLQVFIKQEEVDADSNSGDRSAEQFQGDGNEVGFGPILLKYEVLPFGRGDQPQEKSTESEANENLGRDVSAATFMEDSIQESVVNEMVPDGKRIEHACHCHPGVHSLHRTTKGVHGTNKENEVTEDLPSRDDSSSSVLSPTTPIGQMRRKTVKRMHEKADGALGFIKERFSKPNKSPFESLGKHWAEKMHSLRRQQRLFAEKLINDIFYEAEFGRLSYGCNIVSSPHPSLQHGSFPNSLPQTQQFCMPHPTFLQHYSAFLTHPAPAQTSDSPQSYPIPSPLPSVP